MLVYVNYTVKVRVIQKFHNDSTDIPQAVIMSTWNRSGMPD